VYLLSPSVSLCDLVCVLLMTCVCVRVMTCVPHEGASADLWRFDTSTLGWERVVDTTANGVGPTGRYFHAMTSVGLRDLWMYGGSGDDYPYKFKEMWRFDMFTRGWKLVDNGTVNGPQPDPSDWGRDKHVMTSVGMDLWIHGGYRYSGNFGEGTLCLFLTAVTVDCGVVCVRTMTYVTLTGTPSNDLWRFDTSKDVWETVDNTAVNGEAPTARFSHVMTSVGLDLWLHGGSQRLCVLWCSCGS
jgi:hypothetical protein